MSIKKIIKISFLIIVCLILTISLVNIVVLNKIEENNTTKNKILKLVHIQEHMNKLSIDLITVKNHNELDLIKDDITDKKVEFKEIKKSFINSEKISFLSNFIKDLHLEKNINEDIRLLYANEDLIENIFESLYLLQNKKINFTNTFEKNYPQEHDLRNNIEQKILESKDLNLVKHFSDLKYYSKEALYQHKNEKYFSIWLEKAKLLKEITLYNEFDRYIEIIQEMKYLILGIIEIKKNENILIDSVKRILITNHDVNNRIEQNTKDFFEEFINYNNTFLEILLVITLITIFILSYKVYKNVGISVDEIKFQIRKGLRKIRKLNREIKTTQKEVVFTMGAIGERRSKETANHVKRVAEYSKFLAKCYGLSFKESEILKEASPMHDIGKVAIPDYILHKAGILNEEERKIMETHTQLGYDMLKHSRRILLKTAAVVAYEHHEKWDGSGYPNKLVGEKIHIYGRITALADVFDALGSSRVYKKAWSDEEIFKYFKEQRGKHFDPKLVDIFFANLDEFLKIRDKFHDNIFKISLRNRFDKFKVS